VLELALPPPERRAVLWRAALGVTDERRELVQLAWQLPLAPGRVVRAASVAHELAAIRGTALTADDVREAVSQQVAQKVATLGKRIRDSQTWDDVVLPPETMDSIKELVARVRLRKQVLEDWGFQRKLAKGTGLAAMFLGPPGTGKTMVAGIIAKELGLELYQIDMSRIASKWIGETEKNLASIFDAAEGANVLLLFDECDSLFAKRSEVKSSNDRHANAEVNYLLQRIERFEGVAILTTNLESSIDPAFKRRLAFRIHFTVPDAKERETLWRRMMPNEAKTTSIDYGAFAREYELAGGNIRNAVLRAAFLAAADNSPITESHLERSIVLEYRDAGKLSPGGRLS
jgi:SpoVK/Ycf46/Vps4 family AAA+-type ATPase